MMSEDRKLDAEHEMGQPSPTSKPLLGPGLGAGDADTLHADVLLSPGGELARSTGRSGKATPVVDRESVLLQVPTWSNYVRCVRTCVALRHVR